MEPRPKDIMEVQRASQRWWVDWTIVWKPKRMPRHWISFHRGRPTDKAPDIIPKPKEKP